MLPNTNESDIPEKQLVPPEERFVNDELHYIVYPLGGGYSEDYIHDTGEVEVFKTMYAKMRLGVRVKRSHVFTNERDALILIDALEYDKNRHLELLFPFDNYRTSREEVFTKYPHVYL